MKKISFSGIVGILILVSGSCLLIVYLQIGLRPCGWLDVLLQNSGCLRTVKHDGTRKVIFSPDKITLATVSFDDTVRLWRIDDGALLRTLSLEKPFGRMADATLSPDGTILAMASGATIELWRISNGTLSHILEGQYRTFTIAFGPGGEIIAEGDAGGTVHLWRVSDGALLHTLEPDIPNYDRQWVNSVAFSPDGTLLASADNTVRLWRVSDGTLLHTLEGHTNGVESVAFSPNGVILASAGTWDNTIRLWRVSDGGLIDILAEHTRPVVDVAFSPDGTILASGGEDGTLRLWWVLDGTLLRTLKYGGGWYGNAVSSVAFSPDGMMLATASRYGSVRLLDTQQLLRRDGSHN